MAVLKANGSFLKANGKILVKPKGGGDFVVIGGRAYPVVKIGNQLWMAENLDWKFEGCGIGSSSTSTTWKLGNYYNDDENTYGVNGNKYGLLYNYPAAIHINSIISEGWRVPSLNDITMLTTYLGGNPGTQLKSKYDWIDGGNGTDNYGFCGVPAGIRQTNFMYINAVTVFWTTTEIGQYDAYARGLSYNSSGIGGAWGTNKGFRFSVRLVKDA